MIRRASFLPLLLSLTLFGCTDRLRPYGEAAVQERRAINDAQTELTMAALCDIPVGSFFRILNLDEKSLVADTCDNSGEEVGGDGAPLNPFATEEGRP